MHLMGNIPLMLSGLQLRLHLRKACSHYFEIQRVFNMFYARGHKRILKCNKCRLPCNRWLLVTIFDYVSLSIDFVIR